MTLVLPAFLPPPLVTLAAGSFPEGLEDVMAGALTAGHRDTEAMLRTAAELETELAQWVLESATGAAGAAAATSMFAAAKTLSDLAESEGQLADHMETGARDIEFEKLLVIFTLLILAVQLALAVAVPGGALVAAARWVAAKQTIQSAFLQLLARLTLKGTALLEAFPWASVLVRGGGAGAFQGAGADLAAQHVQIDGHTRDEVDKKSVWVSTAAGFAGGVAGDGAARWAEPAVRRLAARTTDGEWGQQAISVVLLGGIGGVAGAPVGLIASTWASGRSLSDLKWDDWREGVISGFGGGVIGAAGYAIRRPPSQPMSPFGSESGDGPRPSGPPGLERMRAWARSELDTVMPDRSETTVDPGPHRKGTVFAEGPGVVRAENVAHVPPDSVSSTGNGPGSSVAAHPVQFADSVQPTPSERVALPAETAPSPDAVAGGSASPNTAPSLDSGAEPAAVPKQSPWAPSGDRDAPPEQTTQVDPAANGAKPHLDHSVDDPTAPTDSGIPTPEASRGHTETGLPDPDRPHRISVESETGATAARPPETVHETRSGQQPGTNPSQAPIPQDGSDATVVPAPGPTQPSHTTPPVRVPRPRTPDAATKSESGSENTPAPSRTETPAEPVASVFPPQDRPRPEPSAVPTSSAVTAPEHSPPPQASDGDRAVPPADSDAAPGQNADPPPDHDTATPPTEGVEPAPRPETADPSTDRETVALDQFDPLEDLRLQRNVEAALRDAHGDTLIGADPREENSYGGLINGGNPDQPGRDTNCVETSLCAISSYHGVPMAAQRLHNDGTITGRFGEERGPRRAALWAGQGFREIAADKPAVDKYQQLYDEVAALGPMSAALVGIGWTDSVSDTGISAGHMIVLVYPPGADGPVFWDAQSGKTWDSAPEEFIDRTARVDAIVLSSEQGRARTALADEPLAPHLSDPPTAPPSTASPAPEQAGARDREMAYTGMPPATEEPGNTPARSGTTPDPTESRDFGHWLRAVAQDRSLSPAELAKACGTHPNNVYRWLGGHAHPNLENQQRLRAALHIADEIWETAAARFPLPDDGYRPPPARPPESAVDVDWSDGPRDREPAAEPLARIRDITADNAATVRIMMDQWLGSWSSDPGYVGAIADAVAAAVSETTGAVEVVVRPQGSAEQGGGREVTVIDRQPGQVNSRAETVWKLPLSPITVEPLTPARLSSSTQAPHPQPEPQRYRTRAETQAKNFGTSLHKAHPWLTTDQINSAAKMFTELYTNALISSPDRAAQVSVAGVRSGELGQGVRITVSHEIAEGVAAQLSAWGAGREPGGTGGGRTAPTVHAHSDVNSRRIELRPGGRTVEHVFEIHKGSRRQIADSDAPGPEARPPAADPPVDYSGPPPEPTPPQDGSDSSGRAGQSDGTDGSGSESSWAARSLDAELLGAPVDEWSNWGLSEVAQRLQTEMRRRGHSEFEVTGFDEGTGINVEAARECARALIALTEAYPQVNLSRFGVSDLGDSVIGQARSAISLWGSPHTHTGSEIILSANSFASVIRTTATFQIAEEDGWLFPGAVERPVSAIVAHEFAHALDNATGYQSRDVVVPALVQYYLNRGEYEATVEGFFGWLRSGLSGYAELQQNVTNHSSYPQGPYRLNIEEAVAEAFAEVWHRGDDATDAAGVIAAVLTAQDGVYSRFPVFGMPGSAESSTTRIADGRESSRDAIGSAELLGVPERVDEWSGLAPDQVGEKLQADLQEVLNNPEFEVFGFQRPGLDPDVVREIARGVAYMAREFPQAGMRRIGFGEGFFERVPSKFSTQYDYEADVGYIESIEFNAELLSHPQTLRDLTAELYSSLGEPFALRRSAYATAVYGFVHALDNAHMGDVGRFYSEALTDYYLENGLGENSVIGLLGWLNGHFSSGSFDLIPSMPGRSPLEQMMVEGTLHARANSDAFEMFNATRGLAEAMVALGADGNDAASVPVRLAYEVLRRSAGPAAEGAVDGSRQRGHGTSPVSAEPNPAEGVRGADGPILLEHGARVAPDDSPEVPQRRAEITGLGDSAQKNARIVRKAVRAQLEGWSGFEFVHSVAEWAAQEVRLASGEVGVVVAVSGPPNGAQSAQVVVTDTRADGSTMRTGWQLNQDSPHSQMKLRWQTHSGPEVPPDDPPGRHGRAPERGDGADDAGPEGSRADEAGSGWSADAGDLIDRYVGPVPPSYTELRERMRAVAERHPGSATLDIVGFSEGNVPVEVLSINGSSADSENIVVIVDPHPMEQIGRASALALAEHVAANPRLRSDASYHFVVSFDPDSAVLNSRWPAMEGPVDIMHNHVNIHRDSGAHQPEWRFGRGGGSSVMPESRAIMKFVDSLDRPPSLMFSLHNAAGGGAYALVASEGDRHAHIEGALADRMRKHGEKYNIDIEKYPAGTATHTSLGRGVSRYPEINSPNADMYGSVHYIAERGGIAMIIELPQWDTDPMDRSRADYAEMIAERKEVLDRVMDRLPQDELQQSLFGRAAVSMKGAVDDRYETLTTHTEGPIYGASHLHWSPLRSGGMLLRAIGELRTKYPDNQEYATAFTELGEALKRWSREAEDELRPRWNSLHATGGFQLGFMMEAVQEQLLRGSAPARKDDTNYTAEIYGLDGSPQQNAVAVRNALHVQLESLSSASSVEAVAERVSEVVGAASGEVQVRVTLPLSVAESSAGKPSVQVEVVDSWVDGAASSVRTRWELTADSRVVERAVPEQRSQRSSDELDTERAAAIESAGEREVTRHSREVRQLVMRRLDPRPAESGESAPDELQLDAAGVVLSDPSEGFSWLTPDHLNSIGVMFGELHANAAIHAPDNAARVRIESGEVEGQRWVRVAVTNSLAEGQAAQLKPWSGEQQELERNGGRGTPIVHKLSDANGRDLWLGAEDRSVTHWFEVREGSSRYEGKDDDAGNESAGADPRPVTDADVDALLDQFGDVLDVDPGGNSVDPGSSADRSRRALAEEATSDPVVPPVDYKGLPPERPASNPAGGEGSSPDSPRSARAYAEQRWGGGGEHRTPVEDSSAAQAPVDQRTAETGAEELRAGVRAETDRVAEFQSVLDGVSQENRVPTGSGLLEATGSVRPVESAGPPTELSVSNPADSDGGSSDSPRSARDYAERHWGGEGARAQASATPIPNPDRHRTQVDETPDAPHPPADAVLPNDSANADPVAAVAQVEATVDRLVADLDRLHETVDFYEHSPDHDQLSVGWAVEGARDHFDELYKQWREWYVNTADGAYDRMTGLLRRLAEDKPMNAREKYEVTTYIDTLHPPRAYSDYASIPPLPRDIAKRLLRDRGFSAWEIDRLAYNRDPLISRLNTVIGKVAAEFENNLSGTATAHSLQTLISQTMQDVRSSIVDSLATGGVLRGGDDAGSFVRPEEWGTLIGAELSGGEARGALFSSKRIFDDICTELQSIGLHGAVDKVLAESNRALLDAVAEASRRGVRGIDQVVPHLERYEGALKKFRPQNSTDHEFSTHVAEATEFRRVVTAVLEGGNGPRPRARHDGDGNEPTTVGRSAAAPSGAVVGRVSEATASRASDPLYSHEIQASTPDTQSAEVPPGADALFTSVAIGHARSDLANPNIGNWALHVLDNHGVEIRLLPPSDYRVAAYPLKQGFGYDPAVGILYWGSEDGTNSRGGRVDSMIHAASLIAQADSAGPLDPMIVNRAEYAELMTSRTAEAYALVCKYHRTVATDSEDDRAGSRLGPVYDTAHSAAVTAAKKVFPAPGLPIGAIEAAAHRAGVRAVGRALNMVGMLHPGRTVTEFYLAQWDRAHGFAAEPPPGDLPSARIPTLNPAQRWTLAGRYVEEIEDWRKSPFADHVAGPAERAYTRAYDKVRSGWRTPWSPPPTEEAARLAGRQAVDRYLRRVGPEAAEIEFDVVRAQRGGSELHWGRLWRAET